MENESLYRLEDHYTGMLVIWFSCIINKTRSRLKIRTAVNAALAQGKRLRVGNILNAAFNILSNN